ncbi:hypothetical protein JVU11DRAFT_10755 [Chiua virens]|nr:hypothetical protein JVU11DRAFT_10755 [Chiua virens]
MTFSLTRPSSPAREGHITTQDHEVDHLSSALHAALSSFVPGSSAHPDHHHDMIREKERVGIDIVVDSDCISLKGTGVDVEPALLKGHIVLHLREPTSIKEITLQFKGKAKLPASLNDSSPLSASPQWYTICNHEWSFLEGERRHSHTLKAGFHQFPFQLQLGGSLPSSIASNISGGAYVSYKLRAVAVRPGLAHNLQAVMPISIVRIFAPEALEYQQSLEIENTWPEKLMYSILIPHKAWAAGDKLTAIVKFSPLAKGVRVLMVTTTISETTKLHSRGGVQEQIRSVVTANHELLNGNAVPVAGRNFGIPLSSTSSPPTPGLSNGDRSQSFGSLAPLANQDLTLRQVPSRASSSSHDSHLLVAPPLPSNIPLHPAEPVVPTSTTEGEIPISQDDIVSQLTLFIPKSVTPSHTLEPITVSHRIRWSFLISNTDGHASELRCSLPLHILDPRLLDEARANCAVTRRLLLGGSEAPADEEQDVELPSYSAHVRDRVANMYLPDSATTRVPNPWVHSGVSPTLLPEHRSLSGAWTPSGATSPLTPHTGAFYLPHVPQSGTSTPLDLVNSELLLSLSNTAPPQSHADTSPYSTSPDVVSRPESRFASRRHSRAPSPERRLTMTTIAPLPVSTIPASHETFLHDGHVSRSLPGLFNIQMKPQMSLPTSGWLHPRPNSHSSTTSSTDAPPHRLSQNFHISRQPSVSSTLTISVPVSMTSTPTTEPDNHLLWHRAFTEVPDYDVASRGFIGGVTPLTSLRGLPSYEEAERTAHGANSEDEEPLMIRRAALRRVA